MPPRPNRLFVFGLALVVIGAVLPFLMVIGVFEASLVLSLVSYLSSVSGLFLGILSAAAIFEERRRDQDQGEDAPKLPGGGGRYS